MKEPNLARPFRAPLYPASQFLALLISIIAFVSMLVFNFKLGLIYLAILFFSYVWMKTTTKPALKEHS
jgi:ethanolamine permease